MSFTSQSARACMHVLKQPYKEGLHCKNGCVILTPKSGVIGVRKRHPYFVLS